MDSDKYRALEVAGFEAGTVQDFLQLTSDEMERVEEVRAEAH